MKSKAEIKAFISILEEGSMLANIPNTESASMVKALKWVLNEPKP